jgi:peptide/nickel transport system substrate-binding protein
VSRSLVAVLAASLPLAAGAGVRPAYGGTIRIGVPERPPALGAPAAVQEGPIDLLLERAVSAPLLELDDSGGLAPGVLAEVPVSEAGGRAWRLRVRPGLSNSKGAPLGAADVRPGSQPSFTGRAVARVGGPADPGADQVLSGRAKALAG